MPLQLRSAAAVHRKVGMETYSGVLSIPEYLIIHRPKADYRKIWYKIVKLKNKS